MKSINKILLFIPMYNCGNQIVRVLKKCDIQVQKYINEIIIINNMSTDDGEQRAKEFISQNEFTIPVRLFCNKQNYSLGGSHKIAFQYAVENEFDYVIVLHGDDQGDIHDIIPYLRSGRAMQYDSFLGSRFEKNSQLTNYSKFRIFGNHVFNIYLSGMLKRHISDLGSGLNMYRVNYLKSGFYKYFPNNLTFNVYMLLYSVYARSSFIFFPLTWKEEDQISNAKFVEQSLEIFFLVLKFKIYSSKTFHEKKNMYSMMRYISEEVVWGQRKGSIIEVK